MVHFFITMNVTCVVSNNAKKVMRRFASSIDVIDVIDVRRTLLYLNIVPMCHVHKREALITLIEGGTIRGRKGC